MKPARLTALGFTLFLALAPSVRASAATIAAPRVVADVGSVLVSWKPVNGATLYSVESGRDLHLCVTKSLSCRVTLHTAQPVRFRLRVTTTTDELLSGWSYTVTPHLVVVVAGQSNALGQESYVVDPSNKTNYFGPRFRSVADSTSRISWLPWWTQRPPTSSWQALATPQYLRSDTGRTQPIFGPEIGLARQIWSDSRTPIWVIKGAFPYTSLAVEWKPGGGLYSALTKSVVDRMRADARTGTVDVLGAVYWYQGENDALVTDFAASYEANLNQLLDSFGRDLPFMNGPAFILAKPSIDAWVGVRERSTACADCQQLRLNDALVRTSIDRVAVSRHDTTVVDTFDLERTTVQIHISNRGELELGSRLAKASEAVLGLSGPLALRS